MMVAELVEVARSVMVTPEPEGVLMLPLDRSMATASSLSLTSLVTEEVDEPTPA